MLTFASVASNRDKSESFTPYNLVNAGSLESAYPTLSADEQAAFTLWDSCARETLNYLLAVSSPNFANRYGPNVGSSSGIDLATSYSAYMAKRQQYRNQPDIKKLLGEILTQNEKLKTDASKVTAQSIFNAGKDVVAAADAVYGATRPAAASPTKPAPAAGKTTAASNQ